MCSREGYGADWRICTEIDRPDVQVRKGLLIRIDRLRCPVITDDLCAIMRGERVVILDDADNEALGSTGGSCVSNADLLRDGKADLWRASSRAKDDGGCESDADRIRFANVNDSCTLGDSDVLWSDASKDVSQ